MTRTLVLALPLLVLLAGCGDPDQTAATVPSETQDPAEPAVGEARPDVINRTEAPQEPGDLAGVPLEPAVGEGVENGQDYVGVWAPDLEWCENTTGDQVPIQVTPDTFGGYENSCEIAEIAETGQREWEARLRCAGEVEDRRITMTVEGNRLDVVHHDIGDQGISYHRCLPQTNRPGASGGSPPQAPTPELVPPD